MINDAKDKDKTEGVFKFLAKAFGSEINKEADLFILVKDRNNRSYCTTVEDV